MGGGRRALVLSVQYTSLSHPGIVSASILYCSQLQLSLSLLFQVQRALEGEACDFLSKFKYISAVLTSNTSKVKQKTVQLVLDTLEP